METFEKKQKSEKDIKTIVAFEFPWDTETDRKLIVTVSTPLDLVIQWMKKQFLPIQNFIIQKFRMVKDQASGSMTGASAP